MWQEFTMQIRSEELFLGLYIENKHKDVFSPNRFKQDFV